MKIELTLDQLREMLQEQKILTIEKLLGQTYYYNKESDSGNLKTLPIDKDKFKEVGIGAKYPSEFCTLVKYLPKP